MKNRTLHTIQAHQHAKTAQTDTVLAMLSAIPLRPDKLSAVPVSTEAMRSLVDRASLAKGKDRRQARNALVESLIMSDHFGRSSARIFADRLISERRRQFNDDPETGNP